MRGLVCTLRRGGCYAPGDAGIIPGMMPELGQVGPFVLRSYTILLDVTILLGLGSLAWRGHQTDGRPAAWVDAGLVALAGGIIGGRLSHVAIHWAYFSEHVADIIRVWQGGLDWHGAVVAGLVGLYLGCRLRRIDWRHATDSLSTILPAGAALVYTACLASRCAYGREVPSLAGYPLLVVAELPDLYGIVLPRLSSQLLGIGLSVALVLVAWLLMPLIRHPGVRLWIMLTLVGLASFGVGFTLGEPEPLIGSLRLGQVLDLLVSTIGAVGAACSAWFCPLPPKPTRSDRPAAAPAQGG